MDDVVAKPLATAARLDALGDVIDDISADCQHLHRRAAAARAEIKMLRADVVAASRLDGMTALREEIMRLERLLNPRGKQFPRAWGLTQSEHRILEAICVNGGEPVSSERLALVTQRRAAVDGEHLRVHINHIRKKLKPFKCGILTSYGWGYSPDAALLAVWTSS